jgi:GTPase SAR1 family protein
MVCAPFLRCPLHQGIFPRLAYELFDEKQGGWKISMKYFQNVVDTVRDLMSPNAEEQHYKNGMRKDPDGFMDIDWCQSKTLETWDDLRTTFQQANARVAIAPTQFNPMCTRGHCILVLEVEKPHPKIAGMKQRGRLYVCNLAGAEPAGDLVYAKYKKFTNDDGSFENKYEGPHPDKNKTKELQEQGKKVNQSLAELGQCLLTLAEALKKKKKLKPGDPLSGGNSSFLCKYLKDTMLQAETYLFCAIRPEVRYLSYTFATLGFAKNASTTRLVVRRTEGGTSRVGQEVPSVAADSEIPGVLPTAIPAQEADTHKNSPPTAASELSQPIPTSVPVAEADKRKEAPPTTASDLPQPLPSGTPAAEVDNRKEENARLLAQALRQGSKPWKRSKFSLLGQGRAGKTAFANAVAGRQFEDTASTVGINQLTCDVKHIQAASGAGQREQEWGECSKVPREFEAALADILARKQRATQSDGDAEADEPSGGDIRDYMEAVWEPPALSPEERAVQAMETEEEWPRDEQSELPASQNPDIVVAQAPVVASAAVSPLVTSVQEEKPIEAEHPAGSALAAAEKLPAPKTAAELAPAAPAKPDLDEDMVMKMLATMQDAESGLLISLFDFGGQAVFEVIHHLFLTRNGVYALVFNMEWLLTDGPDKERALRFMRGWLSSIAVHTFNKTTQMTAPVVIVGTRLDKVTSPAAHEQISTILHEHFSDNLAWRSVIGNEDGKDSNGKAFQWFFPVDNKLGKSGASMKRLMSVMSDAIETAEYTHKEVPLTWFKTIDQMADTKKDFLALRDVISTARVCNVAEKEVPLLLSFLHDMGHLMWLDEPGLRDVVILDPVSYLVVPATIIICKLTPDHEDTTHHFMDSHRVCERMHKREWMQLKHDGVLSVKLLPILWEKYQQQSEALQMLMVKFGLLVPLRTGAAGAVTQYLVPTLLSPAPSNDLNVTSWTDAAFSSCYFVFTLSDELSQSSTLTEADLKSAGFLPGGMFERIVGKALSWSQDTAVGCAFDLQSALLHKDVAVLAFGRQRFRLVHCADIHCVRVDVEGDHPVGVQQKLQDFIFRIIDECMKSLLCFPAVVFQSASEDTVPPQTGLCKTLFANELLIPLQQLRKASKGESMLARKGGRTLLTLPEIKSKYGQWLQLYDLRERYDVFLSYRWGTHDSEFTEQLFDMFTNLSVGASNRAVEVFLDRKRLQEGRLFKSDFAAALTHSLVVVPVMSVDALGRMVEHNPTQPDNVLLEWIMILESFAAGKILKVFPVLFGKRKQTSISRDGGGSDETVIADFFADGIKDVLPKIPPATTLAQAADLLRANGIEPSEKMRSYTVHSIVHELLGFLLCKASDFAARQLVGAFADKVVRLLQDCGDAALDAISAPGTEDNPARAGIAASAEPLAQRQNVPPSSSPVPAASTRPLKSLTAEEVGRALGGIGLSTLVPIFAEKGVTGTLLASCEEVSDLMSEEFGVTGKVMARALMKQIEEWNAQGVSGI